MRKSVALSLIAVAIVLGYSVAPAPIDGQTGSVPFTPGQRVTLRFEGERESAACIVILYRDGFLGCQGNNTSLRSAEPETWYNLRFVKQIEKREQ